MNELIKGFFGWPNTKYNELSTYLTALASLVVFITHPEFRQSLGTLVQGMTAGRAITDIIPFFVLGFIVISGFALSLYHVFTIREKSSFEKYCMGAFTIGANAAAAITVGVEEINSGSYILIFFPLWNILIGMVLIIQIRLRKFEVTDENVSLLEVSGNSLALLVVFVITNYAFHLFWAMAFSICLFYSSCLMFLITLIFHPAVLQSYIRRNERRPTRLSRRSGTSSAWSEFSVESKPTRSRNDYSHKSFPMVFCPHCNIRVLPKEDGTCPGCRAKISGS